MRSIYIYAHFLILLLTLAVVKSDDADDQRVAEELYNILCSEEERTPAWYSCTQCCQGMHPFTSQYEPHSLARDLLDHGQSGVQGTIGLDLNEKTKHETCTMSREYTIILKNLLVDLKGPLKPNALTEAGLQDLFYQKKECFYGCVDNPEAKMDCVPFVPDPTAPGGDKALQYYHLYKQQGSNSAVIASLSPKCDKLPSTDPDFCPPKPAGYIIFDQIANAIEPSLMEWKKAQQNRASP